jgi:hypothetical protein
MQHKSLRIKVKITKKKIHNFNTQYIITREFHNVLLQESAHL